MNLERELYDLLESVQSHLPTQMHKVYEQAVDRAMHRHSRRGGGWWRREQREEEISLSVFALVVGLIGGAALMYLFDPERGARRRALLQIRLEDTLSNAGTSVSDTAQRVRSEVEEAVEGAVDSVKDATEQARDDVSQAVDNAVDTTKTKAAQVDQQMDKAVDNAADAAKSTANSVGQAVSGAAKDAANKVRSAAGEVKQQVENATTSDATLTTRVRMAVAGAVRAPGAIQIEVKNGEVTLTGTIPASEVQALVEKVQALPGVSKVDNRLEVHDAAQT